MAQSVFIHGLGQKPSSWDKVISYTEEPDNAVCPDLFALIGNKEKNYTNLYRAFSDYCGSFTAPVNLCGLSLGGVLALNYAIDNPGKVQSLALIAAQYKMPKTLLRVQNVIFKLMPESAFAKMGFPKKDVITLTNSMMGLDFSDKLKDISCRVLIICGVKDGANKKAARNLGADITGAEIYLAENAGHEVNIDTPENLANVLSLFYMNIE